jgi:cytochrome c-type biogenesis protein CcmH
MRQGGGRAAVPSLKRRLSSDGASRMSTRQRYRDRHPRRRAGGWRATAVAAVVLCGGLAGIGHAVAPDEILKDAALEARARTLSRELRCLVCQNQSIDDSDAPLARDLRLLLRERLTKGDSDGAAMGYIVERYGTFVLLKPPVQTNTLLLWLAPLLLLAAMIAGFWRHLARGRTAPVLPTSLSEQEARRLQKMLEP